MRQSRTRAAELAETNSILPHSKKGNPRQTVKPQHPTRCTAFWKAPWCCIKLILRPPSGTITQKPASGENDGRAHSGYPLRFTCVFEVFRFRCCGGDHACARHRSEYRNVHCGELGVSEVAAISGFRSSDGGVEEEIQRGSK